jgi:hypothetical protein
MGFKDFLNKLGGGSSSAGQAPAVSAAPVGSLGVEDIEVAGESYRRETFAHVFAAADRPLRCRLGFSPLSRGAASAALP